jgi:hypothetical protein
VVKDLYVDVSEGSLAVLTAELVVWQIPARLMTFVELTLSVATRVAVQLVTVYQVTKGIPTRAVSEETVFPILNAGTIKPVKITNVLILAERPADLVLNARSTIMLLFADVPEDLQEIHSRAVVGLARMKFVKPAEQTLIVKLDKMTGLSADVKLIILAILYRDVDANVIQAVIVHKLKNVFSSNVWLFAGKELVVTTPTVLPEITVLIVLVLMISWETPELDVTQNVPDTTNVPITRPVSNSSARIPAESLIQMYAVVEPTVK